MPVKLYNCEVRNGNILLWHGFAESAQDAAKKAAKRWNQTRALVHVREAGSRRKTPIVVQT